MPKTKKTNEKSLSVEQEIRHMGVLMEHMDNKISLVAEQYGDIKKTLDGHTHILGQHTKILDRHTETLRNHTEMIGTLAVDMQIVKEDVEFIKGSLKKKIDVEEFAALERRVALLEKRR